MKLLSFFFLSHDNIEDSNKEVYYNSIIMNIGDSNKDMFYYNN